MILTWFSVLLEDVVSIPMKEMNPANLIFWIGLLTIACMLLPVVVVLVRKQFNAGLIALSVYFFVTCFYNVLLVLFPEFPKPVMRYLGILTNLVDAPLMLLFLWQFTDSQRLNKLIKFCLFGFLGFEFVVLAIYGFSVKAISIFSGPGLLIVLSFSFYLFGKYVKTAITHRKDIGKTLMISGILFGYAVYFIVYLFFYVIQTPNTIDALFIYFFASIIACILLSSGLLSEKKIAVKKVANQNGKFKVPKQGFTI
jgi:hypothetical protein